MQDQIKQIPESDEARRLERAIVSMTVGAERERRCSREELARELDSGPGDVLADALTRLDRDGVIEIEGQNVRASRATERLDELELIAL